MSSEQQTILAKMALLQGTIDQCKRTLGSSTAALNASNHQSSTQPLVTKTTWQLTAPSRQPMTTPSTLLRPQTRGTTKLILTQPNRPVHPSSAPIPSINLINPSASSLPQPPSSAVQTLFVPQKPSPAPTPPRPTMAINHSSSSSSSSTLPINPSPSPSIVPALNLNPPSASSLSSNQSIHPTPSSANTSKPEELVLDGVSFVRDTQGKKLVRKTVQSTSFKDLPKNEGTKPTPIKALVGGMTYIRTKSGNLVELSALQKFQSQKLQQLKRARLVNAVNVIKTKYQPNHSFSNNNWDPKKVYSKTIKLSRPPLIKKNQQCQFFAKTGACRNGLTCVYQHDPLQVAICPRFLRRRCTHSATSCPLSHVPNAHNMEHCSHFPRCTKSDCPYPHVQPTTSQICQEFADLGWCSKGAQCTERHVRECPEFSTQGTCSNVGCRLRHIINRNHADHDESQAPEPGPSDEDGTGLFFTDLRGADLGGKRKANQLASNSRPKSPHSKGISHNSDRPVKRFKYDAMADNDDYVMFISSDEEEAGTDSEQSAVADDHSCSVESEELESAPPDDLPEPSRSDPVPDPTPDDRLPLPLPQLEYQQPPQARIRSRLGSEEIEEGEIFEDDDDDDGDDHIHTDRTQPAIDTVADDNSSDDDEFIARQLVGDRLRSLAL